MKKLWNIEIILNDTRSENLKNIEKSFCYQDEILEFEQIINDFLKEKNNHAEIELVKYLSENNFYSESKKTHFLGVEFWKNYNKCVKTIFVNIAADINENYEKIHLEVIYNIIETLELIFVENNLLDLFYKLGDWLMAEYLSINFHVHIHTYIKKITFSYVLSLANDKEIECQFIDFKQIIEDNNCQETIVIVRMNGYEYMKFLLLVPFGHLKIFDNVFDDKYKIFKSLDEKSKLDFLRILLNCNVLLSFLEKIVSLQDDKIEEEKKFKEYCIKNNIRFFWLSDSDKNLKIGSKKEQEDHIKIMKGKFCKDTNDDNGISNEKDKKILNEKKMKDVASKIAKIYDIVKKMEQIMLWSEMCLQRKIKNFLMNDHKVNDEYENIIDKYF